MTTFFPSQTRTTTGTKRGSADGVELVRFTRCIDTPSLIQWILTTPSVAIPGDGFRYSDLLRARHPGPKSEAGRRKRPFPARRSNLWVGGLPVCPAGSIKIDALPHR